MEQGSRINLMLKLAGSAFGLVAMLSIAAAFGPTVFPDKTSAFFIEKNSPDAPVASIAPADRTSIIHSQIPEEVEDVGLAFAKEAEINLITEARLQQVELDRAFHEARIAVRESAVENFERLIDMHSSKVEALSEAIEEIQGEISVPVAIKEVMIADLEMQMDNADEKLSEIQKRVESFAYHRSEAKSFPLPLPNNQCDETIIFEKCEGECAAPADEEGDSKGSVEAFYWI